MHLKKEDILQMESRIKRLNIINSITGIKPANLIGTVSEAGETNLGIFSSLVHLGSDPALLGFVLRPSTDVRRHTYENLLETKEYTINHVHHSNIEQAHYTSAKFPKEVSEFDKCDFTEEYIAHFKAPFVKESIIKIGMRYVESLPIQLNGTTLVIGEIEHIIMPDGVIDEAGQIDLEKAGTAGISGLNSYYAIEKIGEFPFARPNEIPSFL